MSRSSKKGIKQKFPNSKPTIEPILAEILSPEDYNPINYTETFRKIDGKPVTLGRDWASLRAYQMFCNRDPSKCSYEDASCNQCGYTRSLGCGKVWKAKDVSVRKSAQSRWSEFILSFVCFLADVYGWTIGYYMPSLEHLKKWGDERIKKKCIESSERLNKICHFTKDYIRFNDTYFYVFGLHTNPISISLNVRVIDELAEVKNLTFYSSTAARLQDKAKDEQFSIRISTPMIPGRDISEEFEEGTREKWHVPCPSCGKLQKLHFLTNIDVNARILKCLDCGGELDRLSDGVWLPENPGASMVSIQYEHTYCQPASMDEMIQLYQCDVLEDILTFYWHKLGLPYVTEGSEVTEGMIKKCPRYKVEEYRKPDGYIRTAGVDVGNHVFDIRISDQKGEHKIAIASGTIPYPEENKKHGDIAWADLGILLFDYYGCDFVVVDNMPRTEQARIFANKYKNRVYRCSFHQNKHFPEWNGVDEDDRNKRFLVYINRDTLLNTVQHQIALGNIEYPSGFFKEKKNNLISGLTQCSERYITHMTSMFRADIIEKVTKQDLVVSSDLELIWIEKSKKGNHQFLAEAYDTLAGMMIKKDPKIIKVKKVKRPDNIMLGDIDSIVNEIYEDIPCRRIELQD